LQRDPASAGLMHKFCPKSEQQIEKEEIEMKDLNSLEEKAMLCHTEIHFYGFRKYDREVSDATAESFNADEDSGRYNKSLIEREGLKYLKSISGDIRRYHRRNTLPWYDDGFRILPAQHYTEYTKGLREKVAEFEKEATAFCKTLPDLYKNAEKKLGKMYKKGDYPDPNSIREKYWVKVKISPVPLAEDFRVVSLGKKDLDNIKKDIEEQKTEAVKDAMKSLWQRLKTPIEKMVEKLSEKDSEFRDSLVGNIITMVELVPKLNLGDPEIAKFARDIESKLCAVDPKILRKDEKVRKETAKAAKPILDKMAGYC
jgi:hypothetical protein